MMRLLTFVILFMLLFTLGALFALYHFLPTLLIIALVWLLLKGRHAHV